MFIKTAESKAVLFRYYFEDKEDEVEFLALRGWVRGAPEGNYDYVLERQEKDKEEVGKALAGFLNNGSDNSSKKYYASGVAYYLAENYPKGEYRIEAYEVWDYGRTSFGVCKSYYIPAKTGKCFSHKRSVSKNEIDNLDIIICDSEKIINTRKWLERFSLPSSFQPHDSSDEEYIKEIMLIKDKKVSSETYSNRDDLISIKFLKPAEVICDKAFYNCRELINVVVEGSVFEIGNEAFANCAKLERVTLFSTIRNIGDMSFFMCHNLIEIDIPESLEFMGRNCFQGCHQLDNVILPKGVTAIESATFMHCKTLREIILPDTLSIIGPGAFYGCERIDKIVIPKSVKRIGRRAFGFCTSLKSVQLNDELEEIQARAFYRCSKLIKIVIPEKIKVIEKFSFHGCSALREVIFPKTLERICEGAFTYCFSLETVSVPQTTIIENNSFRSQTEIKRI